MNYISYPVRLKMTAKAYIFELVSQYNEKVNLPLSVEEINVYTALYYHSITNKVDAFGNTELHEKLLETIKLDNMADTMKKFCDLGLLVYLGARNRTSKYIVGPQASKMFPNHVLIEGGETYMPIKVKIID